MARFRCPRCINVFEVEGYNGLPSCGECMKNESRIVKVERIPDPPRGVVFTSADVTAVFGGEPVAVPTTA